MAKKQIAVPRAVRPQEPVRRVGLIRLGKIVLLVVLLTTTTATIAAAAFGFVGQTTLTTKSSNGLGDADSVAQSILGPAAGAGTVLFWLGLAAVNLRRKGVKDNRSEKRSRSSETALPQDALAQGALRSEIAA